MSGAGGLIGGAALGTAFNVLYDVLNELIAKNVIFKPLLKDIKSGLDSLAPLLKDIEKSNKKLDLSDKELGNLKEHLEKGIEVVMKCKKIRWWSLYKRYKYTNKLIEWDESLQQLLQIVIVQGTRDMKDSFLSVRNIETVRRLPKQLDCEAFCAVPELPPLVVGLDFPPKELKRKLLKDENVSMVVLTTPGGCGKTTLAAKFCQDKDVKDTFKDNIFFVTVSKKPKLENIVHDLYQRKGFPVPIFQNEVGAVMLLQRFLKEVGQNPLLLVLDDVWSGSESLVEKFDQIKTENHKFLVTSRSEFRGYGFPYYLQSLDHDNAKKLFHHSASLGDKSSHIPKDLSEKTELLLCLERSLGALDKEMVVKDVAVTVKITEEAVRRLPKQLDCEAFCTVPELPPLVVGLDFPLKELKRKLLKEKNVSMVLLTAPGGCGKTTLAAKLCQDKDVKDTFKDNIFFVTVSKMPKLENIVQDLYQRKGFPAPTFQNEVSAVTLLQCFLKEEGQNPLLLVLDDVWPGSDSLVEKFDQFKTENYKFLVTSRPEFRGCDFPYYLQPLNYDDAMKLFHHSASLGDKSSHIPKDLPEKIVERCKGFPLAITMAGRSLCRQPIEIWPKRELDWSKGFPFLDSETELLLCLERSLDAVDKEIIKECFLDLGAFPEDQRIPAAALIDIWAELYDLDTDIECIANLYELTKRSLANLQTKNYALPDSVGNMGELKAVIVTNYGFLPAQLSNFQLLGSLPNLKRIRLERISIPSITKNLILLVSLKKISLFMCNIGQAFNNCSISISSAFPNLEEMNINYCSDLIELPAEVCDLSKPKKLNVTNCHKLSALPEGIGKLKNLEMLRLRSCTGLLKLPTSMKNLGKVNFLDISDCCSILELPKDIGEMSSLRKINMRQCSRFQELPLSVKGLEQLKEVVCDEEAKYLWESFSSYLKNVSIIVAKENINLNWLHKTQ